MAMHDGHRERTREEFLARPDSFPDHRLLEVLLFFSNPRRDTNPLAHLLMERFGSLAGVLDALPDELLKVPGVGEYTVALLKTAKEVGGRYLASRTSGSAVVDGYERVKELLAPCFFGARTEKVCLLCMDAKGKELGVRLVSEGSVNSASVVPRSVVESALSLNASRVILAHNHPSGLALPSDEDKATTVYMAELLDRVGIILEDHLIFVDDDMVSLRQSGFKFHP